MNDMDWADEIAAKVVAGCSSCKHCGNINRDDLMPGFSLALRKANASGMREAAEIAKNDYQRNFEVLWRDDLFAFLNAAASKLENGD